IRRAAATGVPLGSLVKVLANFATTVALEKVHPLQGGILRLKHPDERRPGLPRESAWLFWPRFVWQTLSKHAVLVATIARLTAWTVVIWRDPDARRYIDQALTPVGEHDDEAFDLLTKTTGARAAIDHQKKVHDLTHRTRAVVD